MSTPDGALWTALGLTENDVRVYHSLLQDPALTVAERAAASASTATQVRASLATLVGHGLAYRRDGIIRPARPQAVLLSIARARRTALDSAEGVAAELEELFGASSAFTRVSSLFEVIRGGESIIDRVRELVATSARSVDSIDTPPYVAGHSSSLHAAETAASSRGVRMRSLVDFSALEDELHVVDVLRSVAEGQQVRLSSRLHTKLVLFDREQVVIPLTVGLPVGEPHIAIIQHREIVDALQGYFDVLFEGASALDPLPQSIDCRPTAEPFLSVDEQRLVQLLSSGMTDTAIARHLSVSDRTLRRRIGALQERFEARSRFQLGQILERRRLLG